MIPCITSYPNLLFSHGIRSPNLLFPTIYWLFLIIPLATYSLLLFMRTYMIDRCTLKVTEIQVQL